MNPTRNEFKRRLRAREQQLGVFATIADASWLELLAGWRLDWILVDTEHASTEVAGVADRLRVLDGTATEAVVRPAWSDPVLVKRVLDAGARTLLLPQIGSAEEAAAAVRYTRYPPEGVRGVSGVTRAARYGQDPGYLRAAADELCVVVQIETAEGLRDLEAIATTPGVDAVFVGPSDLAASLGHLGDAQHPRVQEAIDDAFARLRRLGVPTGYLTLRLQEARQRLEEGVDVVGVATDTSIMGLGLARLAEALGRDLAPEGLRRSGAAR